MKVMLRTAIIFIVCFSLTGCGYDSDKKGVFEPTTYDTKMEKSMISEPANTGSEEQNQKLVKTAQLSLQTKRFKKDLITIEKQIQTYGGYIETKSVQELGIEETGQRSATYRVRIPATKLDAYVNDVKKDMYVVIENVTTEDITKTYRDTKSWLNALNLQQKRLLELIVQAKELKDLIELERELTNVRQQIESTTVMLKEYDSLVNYSVVTLELYEVNQYRERNESLWERIQQTFKESVQQIQASLENTIVFLIGNSPLLLFLGAIIFGVLVGVRRWRRSKKG